MHVKLNYKDGEAGPIETEGHYDAKLFHKDFQYETVSGDVWLEFASGEQETYAESDDPVFTGYFVGYDTRNNDDDEEEERPVISSVLTPATDTDFILHRCDSESNGDPEKIYVVNKFCPKDVGRTVRIAEYESCYTIAVDDSACPSADPSTESEQESDDEAVARINDCSEPICVTVLEIFDDCEVCLCEDGAIPITICGSGTEVEEEVIYANKLAMTDEEVEVDLSTHKDEIVRLEDGRCGVVGQCTALPTSDPAEDVVVLEFYPAADGTPCDTCLITKLVNCNDEEDVIITFSDLTEYSDEDFIQKEDSDPLACYQKDHTDDPIAWDPMDPPVRFNAAPRKEFADCDECRGEVIYRLTHECTPEICDPEKADDVEDIVTADTDLAGGDGKYFKREGLAYSCAIDEEAEEADITHEDIDVQGPFDTCEEALAAPMAGRIPTLRKVTISDTNVPRWHVNAFIFNDSGQLTGVCPEVVTAEGTEC